MTIFSYLRAALISEFWTLTDLNEWIINVLTASNKYHYELYDLLYVKDFEKVMEALSHLAALEDYTKYNEI